MESIWLLTALLLLAALLLGGRLSGLTAPPAWRAALASLGSSALSLAAILLRCSWASLLTLPAAAIVCYAPQGHAGVCRAMVMTLLSTFLAGGCGLSLLRLTSCVPVCLGGAFLACLLVLPLIRLLPDALLTVTQLELRMGENQVLLPAMTDSGNLLRDPITGMAVIVVSARAIRPLFPGAASLSDPLQLPEGFRLLPVRTAAGSALMPLFRPDGCLVYHDGCPQPTPALVAVAPESYRGVQALVPASLPQRQAKLIGGQR